MALEKKTFTSKIDSDLHKAAKLYCIKEDIDLIDLIDKSLRREIDFYPEEQDNDKEIFVND